jgi:hypothetical protein
MFEAVDVGAQSIDNYRASAGDEAVEMIQTLAAPLRDARVLHVNATPYGGGVAEDLSTSHHGESRSAPSSRVPLRNSLTA